MRLDYCPIRVAFIESFDLFMNKLIEMNEHWNKFVWESQVKAFPFQPQHITDKLVNTENDIR